MHIKKSDKVLLLLLAFMLSLGFNAVLHKNSSNNVIPSNLVKTVAHVKPNTGYTLYYKDEEADVAYYIPTGEITHVTVGEVVHMFDGTETEVYSTDLNGFTINLPANTTASGLSGSHVLNADNVSVGIISKLLGKDKLYCIYNEM